MRKTYRNSEDFVEAYVKRKYRAKVGGLDPNSLPYYIINDRILSFNNFMNDLSIVPQTVHF